MTRLFSVYTVLYRVGHCRSIRQEFSDYYQIQIQIQGQKNWATEFN